MKSAKVLKALKGAKLHTASRYGWQKSPTRETHAFKTSILLVIKNLTRNYCETDFIQIMLLVTYCHYYIDL